MQHYVNTHNLKNTKLWQKVKIMRVINLNYDKRNNYYIKNGNYEIVIIIKY